ncbi:MAG: FadR/GntR family transcriptional regulator [Burkholderiales bacterium]
MPIQTVEPQRLYRQIAAQLSALIANGEYDAGARLPAERDLAKQFGVSRPSIREALIALEVEGWVEVRTGSGVYVVQRLQPDEAARGDTQWDPLELIRARRVVEGEVAALAATQARRKHLQSMTQAIDEMRALATVGVNPIEADRTFHMAIVSACANAVLAQTVVAFWGARLGPLFKQLGGYRETSRIWHASIAEHERVHAAIADHDPAAARAAMHHHMDKAHQRFRASWRRARSPDASMAP